MYDDKGLSSIIVHSEKGRSLFDAVVHQLSFKEALIEDVELYNPDYIRSQPFVYSRRKAFWADYHKHEMSFKELLEKHLGETKKQKIQKHIKKVIKKCLPLLKKLRS